MIPLHNLRRFFYKFLRQPGYAFKVAMRRMCAFLYYYFGQGKSSYPEAVTLFLTHKCNLRCKMCGQWGESGVTKKQSTQYIQEELPLDELKSIIDDIALFKPNITLFGGEPLIYHNCLEIIKYIKQKGMHCLIITNGYLLEGLAESIVDSGLDELNVSLDGGASLHDEIRGMPGLFDKIMRGLKQVNYFKVQKNKKKPLVNLQCAISKYNYKFLEQLIDVANEAKADSLTFHNLIFTDQEVIKKQKEFDTLLGCSSFDWEGFAFNPEIDPDLLYEKISKILFGKYDFNVDFYPNLSYKAIKEYYQDPGCVPVGYNLRCLSPWIVAYIFPDAEVRPCLNSSYSFGNLRKNNFSQVWNSKEAIHFRKVLKTNQMFPLCARCTELYRY